MNFLSQEKHIAGDSGEATAARRTGMVMLLTTITKTVKFCNVQ
jgi:hypothetical protein